MKPGTGIVEIVDSALFEIQAGHLGRGLRRRMDWNDLAWKLREPEGFEEEIAYRVALRSLLLVTSSMDRTWSTQSIHGKNLLRLIRAVLIARVSIDNPNIDYSAALRGTHQLMSTVNIFDQSHRISRLMSGVFIERTRSERLEDLRREIQASKDGFENFKVKSRKPIGFLDIDVWYLVDGDYNELKGGYASPPIAVRDKSAVSGAWSVLGENISRFDPDWYPWAAWLEYRLFGDSFSGLTESHWRDFERYAADLPRGIWDDPLQLNQNVVRKLTEIIETCQDELEEIEEQSRYGLTFDVDDVAKQIVLSRGKRAPLNKRLTVLIQETGIAIDRLIDASSDNSSADIRIRAQSYKESLDTLEEDHSKMLLVVRGESLRSALKLRERSDEYSDIPPLKDSCLYALRDVISQHNVLVGLDAELSAIDRLLPGPANPEPTVPPSLINSIVGQHITVAITSQDVRSALSEVSREAQNHPDNDRVATRASESGKNLVRSILSTLYGFMKRVAVPAIAIPSVVYAFGKWALANEATILGYFTTNPGMHNAIKSLLEWIRTLPLA